jgi:hypothetical protein
LKKLVEGSKMVSVELKPQGSLFFMLDNGMVSYVYSEKPLKFDFNWMKGYEFLCQEALKITARKRTSNQATTKKRASTTKRKTIN